MNDILTATRERLRAIIRTSRGPCCSPRFDTSDVIQDSLIQVAHELSTEPRTRLSGRWLSRIAIGHLAKHLRFHNAKKRSVANEIRNPDSEDHLWYEADPFEKTSKTELAENALFALTRLDEIPRRVLMMRFFDEAGFEEIADRLGISVYIARSSLAIGLRQIKAQIDSTIARRDVTHE